MDKETTIQVPSTWLKFNRIFTIVGGCELIAFKHHNIVDTN